LFVVRRIDENCPMRGAISSRALTLSPGPESSGENLPIPKLGAESPDRYLPCHELTGNELKRSKERQS
jgi:hypothetical protein